MSVEIQEIGIAGYQVKHIEEYRFHSIVHLQREQSTRPACPCCRPEGAPDERSDSGRLEVYRKGPYTRHVRHLDAFGRTTYLQSHTHRATNADVVASRSFQPSNPSINKCNTPTNS